MFSKKVLKILLLTSLFFIFSCSERTSPSEPGNGGLPPTPPSWVESQKPGNGAVNALLRDHAGNLYAATDGNGVIMSGDNGTSWKSWNAGLSDSVATCFTIDSSGTIWAGILPEGLYHYSDVGKSWKPLNSLKNGFWALGTGNDGTLFAATNYSILHSNDQGSTWLPQISPNFNGPVLDFLFQSNDSIFAGTLVSGIIQSDDGGNTWAQNIISQITIPALISNSRGDIIAGSLTQGGFISHDNGVSWELLQGGFGGGAYQFICNSINYIYYCQYGEGIYRSTDDGVTWMLMNLDLSDLSVTTLCLDANEHIIAGTFTGRLFRSNFSSTIKDL